MNCPNCNGKISMKHHKCELCGADLTIYKRVICLSNLYYNEGLAKARVRDLSGAVLVLKKSLELNKRNTDARNLLGLVYFEMGETVSALSSWVISKHLQAQNNDADRYMDSIQKNATKLDVLNQTIRKYNLALQSAQNGNDDLAILQLKKVTTMNPHYIQALQLLSLLYMKAGEMERARRYLLRAQKIDVSNTKTLRLLDVMKKADTQEEKEDSSKEVSNGTRGEVSFMPISSYKEEKPNIRAWINLFLGVVIGIAFGYFLIVPAVRQKLVDDLSKEKIDYSEQVSEYNAKISTLEKTNDNLNAQVKELKTKLDGIEIPEQDEKMYDSLFNAFKNYMEEIKKPQSEQNMEKVASELVKVKETALENKTALELYNTMKEASFEQSSANRYEEGHTLYSQGKYEDALKKLLEAYEYKDTNVDAIYFIGRCYHQMRDYENAKKYYEIIAEDFKDTIRYSEAKARLAELPK